MKHIFRLLLTVLLTVCLATPVSALSASDIVSETAVLMDANTGQVLFDKGMHRRMFPASTTKVMTALLVCENSDPSEIATVSDTAVDIEEWNSSNIALRPGEETTVDELLYALMLPSANDAANVLAEHVAGSQEKFAEMMTARAKEMGATETHFSNAHGLHESTHYTTAYDMALITGYALQNPTFRKYFGTDLHTMSPTNLQTDERYFTNMQYMVVKETQYYNEAVMGGKVGYTSEAKHTMTTAAERGGRTLVCVVMRSANRWEKFSDTQTLLDYGFDQFRPITLPAEKFIADSVPLGDEAVTFYSENDFTALLRNDIDETQVKINYRLPEAMGYRGAVPAAPIPASAEVVIDTGERTLPSILGVQPIHADVPVSLTATPEDAVPADTHSVSTDKLSETIVPLSSSLSWVVPAVIAFVLLLAAGMFLISHYRLQKRRRVRLAQLRRMRSQYYNRKSA